MLVTVRGGGAARRQRLSRGSTLGWEERAAGARRDRRFRAEAECRRCSPNSRKKDENFIDAILSLL
jgi:hypothetical protein